MRYKIVGNIFQIKIVCIMEEIVVEMNTYTKWWDSWFVVADLTIPLFLDDYDYFNFSPVYLLTDGDVEKKEFIVKKPRRNQQFEWYKMDRVGVIDDLGGLLCEVKKYCGDDIFLVTDSRVLKEDMPNGQKIFIFFALDTREKTLGDGKVSQQTRFLVLND